MGRKFDIKIKRAEGNANINLQNSKQHYLLLFATRRILPFAFIAAGHYGPLQVHILGIIIIITQAKITVRSPSFERAVNMLPLPSQRYKTRVD